MHYKESMCERWMGSRKNKNYVIFLLLFFFSYHLKECIKYGNVILLGLSEFDKKYTYIYIYYSEQIIPPLPVVLFRNAEFERTEYGKKYFFG